MKLNYKPCLCVLNITSWVGYSPDAEHVYGKLKLVEQNTDSDYSQITIDTIEEWRPAGEEIELKRKISIRESIELDKKDGGHTYQRSAELGRCISDRFDTIENLTKFAIKKYKRLKLECDFISLYEWEKFKDTKIIKFVK